MKFFAQLASAILIKNTVDFDYCEVYSGVDYKKPIEKLTIKVCFKLPQLDVMIDRYVNSLGNSPLAYDVGIELKQVTRCAELLSEDVGFILSLDSIVVRIDLYADPKIMHSECKKPFDLCPADVMLATSLTRSSEKQVSDAASLWLQHFSEFMQFVRNSIVGMYSDVIPLLESIRMKIISQMTCQTIHTVQHGDDLVRVVFNPVILDSLDRMLCKSELSFDIKVAANYLRFLRWYERKGWRHGSLTSYLYSCGVLIRQTESVWVELKELTDSNRKAMNRLVSNVDSGRKVDILL